MTTVSTQSSIGTASRVAVPSCTTAHPRKHRTLGPCACCGRPVAYDAEHVRLDRRVWHLMCALN